MKLEEQLMDMCVQVLTSRDRSTDFLLALVDHRAERIRRLAADGRLGPDEEV